MNFSYIHPKTIFFGFSLILSLAGGAKAQSATTTLLSLDGASFQTKTIGEAIGTDWILYSNGYLENSLNFPATGSYQFQVQAYGDVAARTWPVMEVRVDQKVIYKVNVTSREVKTYSLSANLTAGLHKIELAFTNDYYARGQDRNLYIKHLNVLGQDLAAPDLVVNSITVNPAQPLAGSPLTYSAKVTNIGNAATPAGITLGLAFLTDNGQKIWSDTFSSSLAPGASVTLTTNNGPAGLPSITLASGSHTVVANINDMMRFPESHLNNNTLSFGFSVAAATSTTPTPTPTPTPRVGIVGPRTTNFKTSGPITLTSGQVVTGLAISNLNGPCIQGTGVSNVHIHDNKIGPCGPTFEGSGVSLRNVHDVNVEHNSFDDVSTGLFAADSTNNIVFDHNYATRIRGPFPRGQIVQFAGVNGSGHKITCNVSDQTTPGYGRGTEDHVNLYKTNGTAASPILVKYNKIRGGGPSQSGGGLLAGDESSSYITIDTNILVNPGQYGIAIAGGHDNKLLNNKVYSSSFPWTNIGAVVWNQYAPACFGNEVSGNRVNWTNRDGAANNWADFGGCGAIALKNNVFGDTTLNANIWNETFSQCDY